MKPTPTTFMMRILLVFAVVIVASSGDKSHLDWVELRVGDVKMPVEEDEASDDGWELAVEDKELGVTWWSKDADPRFLIGFDKCNLLAGVKYGVLQSEIDVEYDQVYTNKAGIFEKENIHGKSLYYTTVLFTLEGVLKNGGREKIATDEIALGVFLKINGEYEHLYRDACDNNDNLPYTEQACKTGYALVFSKFTPLDKCETLIPFYLMYDPEERGNLIGFGIFSFSKYPKTSNNILKKLSKHSFEERFSFAPKCLSTYVASEGLTAIEIWLAPAASPKIYCSSSEWVDSHCRRTRRGPDGENDF